jgi:AcrR family transcriptional regulator
MNEATSVSSYDRTKTEILQAARKLFSRQGVRKTTLEEIARAMHRTKTFVYHYFQNRDAILSALIAAEGDEYVEELRKAIAEARGAKEKLRAYVGARFRISSRLGTFYQALREEYFQQYAFIEKARLAYDTFEAETVVGILAQGVDEGSFAIPDPRLVARAFLIALKGFELEWAAAGGEVFEREIDTLLVILFDGISKGRLS